MHAPPDLIVRGLALDSRKVEEGFLFFALPGEKEDGGEFIAEAKARGAVCAVEWSENVEGAFYGDEIKVIFEKTGENERRITIGGPVC